jgi:hypothetical protein
MRDKHSRLNDWIAIDKEKSLITSAPYVGCTVACFIKHYGFVIYRKWTDFVVS